MRLAVTILVSLVLITAQVGCEGEFSFVDHPKPRDPNRHSRDWDLDIAFGRWVRDSRLSYGKEFKSYTLEECMNSWQYREATRNQRYKFVFNFLGKPAHVGDISKKAEAQIGFRE